MKNMEKWEKIIGLYKRDERVRDFILDFFKTRRGVRCVCFQDKVRGIYWRYGWNQQKALTGLYIDNFWSRIGAAKGMSTFFYSYVFDESVMDHTVNHWDVEVVKGKERIIIFHDFDIIGGNIVFEIDAPEVGGRKIDFFSKRWYPEFMWVKYRVESVLGRLGVDYRCIFSGNGIYIVIPAGYFDDMKDIGMNLRKFRRTTANALEKIQPFKSGLHPVIDLRDIGWATYFKIPFTFHEIKDRMTIPVAKGYLDREWLDRATNMNNINALSEGNITDILERCRWETNIIW